MTCECDADCECGSPALALLALRSFVLFLDRTQSRRRVSSTVQAAIFAISVPVSPIDEDDDGGLEEEELWPNEKIAMCRSRGTRNVLVVIIKFTSLSPFRGA